MNKQQYAKCCHLFRSMNRLGLTTTQIVMWAKFYGFDEKLINNVKLSVQGGKS